MKPIVLALAVASIGLSGCITSTLVKAAKMTPEQQVNLINAAADAGCKGQLDIGARASTAAGLSPGSIGGEFSFNGGCDPANARTRIISLKDLTTEDLQRLLAEAKARGDVDGIGTVLDADANAPH